MINGRDNRDHSVVLHGVRLMSKEKIQTWTHLPNSDKTTMEDDRLGITLELTPETAEALRSRQVSTNSETDEDSQLYTLTGYYTQYPA